MLVRDPERGRIVARDPGKESPMLTRVRVLQRFSRGAGVVEVGDMIDVTQREAAAWTASGLVEEVRAPARGATVETAASFEAPEQEVTRRRRKG